jgi:hypothetical protein
MSSVSDRNRRMRAAQSKRFSSNTYQQVANNSARRSRQRGPSVLGTFLHSLAAGAGWGGGRTAGRNIAQNVTRDTLKKAYPMSTDEVEGHTFIVMGRPQGPFELIIVTKDGHQRESVATVPTFPEIVAAIQQWETYLHDGGTLAQWVEASACATTRRR